MVTKPTNNPPSAFKCDTNRHPWKEQFTNYIGTKVSQAKAPLSYIIRENDAPGNVQDYLDDHDIMFHMTPHAGIA